MCIFFYVQYFTNQNNRGNIVCMGSPKHSEYNPYGGGMGGAHVTADNLCREGDPHSEGQLMCTSLVFFFFFFFFFFRFFFPSFFRKLSFAVVVF